MASIHLDGEAIAWHRSYMNSRNTTSELSWIEYVLSLNERSGDGFEDPMEALKNLRQTGSVREYHAEFDRLLKAVNLSNENSRSCYLGRLKPELNKVVKIQEPKTLSQAYKISRLQERVFEAQA